MLAAPLVIPPTGSVAVQAVVGAADEAGTRSVSVFSRGDEHPGWTLHAEGVVRPGSADPDSDMSTWPPVGATPVDIDGLYDRLAARGYGYGPAFQGLTAMWRRGDEVFADVCLPNDAGLSPAGFGVHPAVLDAALHAVIVATETGDDHDSTGVLVPFSWQGVSLHAAGRRRCGRGLRRRVRRRCRWTWPMGWGCRCCRWLRWWLVRCRSSN